ncbi:hypothetical protein ASPZODRAFT_155407 [Penicilliopsis zonata CBS 506.65]|uniref:Pyrroline-5-carboxylate reductase n=1 Tax=Penicilliopsis zonata CBS 506.65 TaxID=1073090 RepID=A0A1L9S591_9EURO|nr:hypothetical protein ASPZODRAFT_155407 [Penicilliopsis zonata CBS 506.65]OJJ42307.1 hypothetical protein ASPZODRAFT_155407 [Penicilliopsis zonata CBS 506.65]
METKKLCFLGCGNLGTAILDSLLGTPSATQPQTLLFAQIGACVASTASAERLSSQFANHLQTKRLNVLAADKDNNHAVAGAVQGADVVLLALPPGAIEAALTAPEIHSALADKLLISVAAGWTRQRLESVLGSSSTERRLWVVRTLPNIAALVGESLTAVEDDQPDLPGPYMEIVDGLFGRVGAVMHLPPSQMDAVTAVAGSTPAFFAVIVDAMVDAAVAVGVPRPAAQTMVFQAMRGTAGLLQSGVHPALLKDQGTAPEGCTMGGLMVLEEAAVRGSVGRALREAVTVARRMDGVRHVNDTRE